IYIMYRRRIGEIGEAGELYLMRYIKFEVPSIILQIAISTILLYYGSRRLVSAVDILASMLGVSPMGISLIVVPAVTVLPETSTAIIWGFRGRDTLSIASLIGEKILYSTFYPGIAILVTSWIFDWHGLMSTIATTTVSLILLYYIRRGEIPIHALLLGLIFFISYGYLVFYLHR
ncbi:sodium:calcium antiporter, partial [Candidatus Bathyarchaeota archaeon]|nr:sodium:calcium antiporter [Candidatus Bathyarchaeota archaeon]